jgi:hypothetical protein
MIARMSRDMYDPLRVLARSKLWHIEAAITALPSMRDFCLSEAARCERMVQRSFQTPVLADAEETGTPGRFGT